MYVTKKLQRNINNLHEWLITWKIKAYYATKTQANFINNAL